MDRVAFKMKLFPGFKEEYQKRHDEIWPELVALLKQTGISEYSIFLDEESSSLFGFWIPDFVESYKEIRIIRTIDLGSHMLMWGEPLGETRIKPDTPHLYHIHYLLYLHQKAKGFSYPLV